MCQASFQGCQFESILQVKFLLSKNLYICLLNLIQAGNPASCLGEGGFSLITQIEEKVRIWYKGTVRKKKEEKMVIEPGGWEERGK